MPSWLIIFTREAKTFGIQVEGSVTFDYNVAFQRSRKAADGRTRGVHYLMRKNKIDEIEGWATFTDPHTLDVQLNAGGRETLSFEHCIIATGATARLIPHTQLGPRVVTEIARNVHPHPTLSEAIKEAAHGLEGHMLNM
jgi:dihydrolipoamide dehydrogenase